MGVTVKRFVKIPSNHFCCNTDLLSLANDGSLGSLPGLENRSSLDDLVSLRLASLSIFEDCTASRDNLRFVYCTRLGQHTCLSRCDSAHDIFEEPL